MTSNLRTMFTLALAAPLVFGGPAAFAVSATALASFDSLTIRTDGTATAVLNGLEILEAFGSTTGGVADPANDGMTFAAQYSALGSGEALNGGLFGASSTANSGASIESHAFTFIDLGLAFSGTGNIMLDIAYSLFIDIFDSAGPGYALAGIFATIGGELVESELRLSGTPGIGADDLLAGVLTLSFFIDIDPAFPAFDDVLTIGTYASAFAVPEPTALVLLGAGLLVVLAASPRGQRSTLARDA